VILYVVLSLIHIETQVRFVITSMVVETVQVLQGREHVLLRPETYVGTVEAEEWNTFVVTPEGDFRFVTTTVSPAFLKIFDEVLVNASDRFRKHIEDSESTNIPCQIIKVDFDSTEGKISVWNDGDGIEVRPHTVYKDYYIPDLIFGRMMTGTNFDDSKKRISGGRNGFGAKLANIFSTRFKITTLDAERKLEYTQEFTDNMSVAGTPNITKIRKRSPKPFTCVEFWPDWNRLGMPDGLTEDILGILRKRVYDIAVTAPSKSKVFLHNKELKDANTLKKYMLKHFQGEEFDNLPKIIEETINDRWRVACAFVPIESSNLPPCTSFVNSIATPKGGTHVEYVLSPIISKIQAAIKKKLGKDNCRIQTNIIRDNLKVLIDCLIENPSFDSQRKEELKTKSKDFGSVCKVSDDFIDKIMKSGIVQHVVEIITGKEQSNLLKSCDGKKTSVLRGIPKLEDAQLAGGPKSDQCYLILTEGDSAKASAVAGVSSLPTDMRRRFGIFPLRGKLLNVRGASPEQLEKNSEIKNIKKIVGLQQGQVYEDTSQLRYGAGIIIFTDQDVDGSHIKGLLLNFLHCFWPSLLKLGFACSLATPIVKAFPKNGHGSVLSFYNQSDYDQWKARPDIRLHQYKIKQYKGLGTSTRDESKEHFQDVLTKLIHYTDTDNEADNVMQLAFNKKMADKRKSWLQGYDPTNIISNDQKQVSIAQFVNSDLIHFSYEDIARNIPSLVDGFKPSQRKVFYTGRIRKLFDSNKEIKVAQLAGACSELTCYHHGEASLHDTIIRLAQNYVGSNNLNLLHPQGQFGTRLMGGNDASAPRYIWTFLSPCAQYLFKGEDDGILSYVEEDGIQVEPTHYLPVIPTILVNGALGIGTGWSTFVPSFNPRDIVDNIKRKLADQPLKPMHPWWRGFKGSVNQDSDTMYSVKGVWKLKNSKTVHITELPIGTWTTPYKQDVLEPLLDAKVLSRVVDNCSDLEVNIEVTFTEDVQGLIDNGQLEKRLKLVETVSLNNMHLFPADGYNRVKKYDDVLQIINDFFEVRLDGYIRRKELMLKIKAYQRDILYWKHKFVTDKLEKKIKLEDKTTAEIIVDLEEGSYPKFGSSWDDPSPSYQYLTSMSIFSLTTDRREALKKELDLRTREYDEIEQKEPKQMWVDDIDEVEKYL
jgi:DNA topoisomerase II